MGKANALKAKAAETAAAAGAGNLQVSQPRSLRSLYSLGFPRGQPFPPVVSVLGSSPSWIETLDPSSENHIWGFFKVKPVQSRSGQSFNWGKRRCNGVLAPICVLTQNLQKMNSLKRAVLHPLFCACASCASASTYVCAPMCSNSFHMCFQAAQMSPHVVTCHLHTYVCMRLHMNMYIYLKTFI